ncbi:hypothetical protein BDN67DRAFT_1069242 [Paxillus ammoniavirescens]|nr:hypothetical protein BDN67DRAFT_1069242 [Paxillus ammoniavirescens]
MSRAHQIPSPMNNLQGSVADATYHRRDVPAKSRSMKPLLTHEPLPHAQDRAKKQPAQPAKKRKRAEPTKPPLSFPPRDSSVPSGKQGPPLSSPTFPRPSASESPTSSFDEPQTIPLSDHEIHDQPCDPQHGHDAHKRPRIFAGSPSIGQPTPSYPLNPITDMNDMISAPDFYDSPVSCTSSSSPALSDQSPTGAPELGAVQVADYIQQAHTQMYHDSHLYTQPTVAHHDTYGYAIEGYAVQYIDPDSEINGYSYPPSRC